MVIAMINNKVVEIVAGKDEYQIQDTKSDPDDTEDDDNDGVDYDKGMDVEVGS